MLMIFKIFNTIQNRITELSRHAVLFLQLLDVRYKFQKDQSYDLSITSEESSNLEFHVGKETLILYLNVHF